MTDQQTAQQTAKDMVRQPLPFSLAWGIPIAILVSMNFTRGVLPDAAIILIIAGTFLWMGSACVLNARRCGRLHCFISGPIFLIGAVGTLLTGFNVVTIPFLGVNEFISGTVVLALLTFVPEWIWGMYARR